MDTEVIAFEILGCFKKIRRDTCGKARQNGAFKRRNNEVSKSRALDIPINTGMKIGNWA